MKPLLLIALLFPCVGFCQTQIKVDSIIWMKGQTIYCRGKAMVTDSVYYFPLNFRGAGRNPDVIGKWVTYHPLGISKRRIKFTINN